MDRLVRLNLLVRSGGAVVAAGDVVLLLLDKLVTITFCDRQASEFRPLAGVDAGALADAALLSSLADETPEGRSIVALARERYAVRVAALPAGAEVIPFTAQTRLSGVVVAGVTIRKGAVDSVLRPHPAAGTGPAAPERR